MMGERQGLGTSDARPHGSGGISGRTGSIDDVERRSAVHQRILGGSPILNRNRPAIKGLGNIKTQRRWTA